MGDENPDQGYQAAQVLFQQQRYAESLALLDRLLNSHPGAPELHYARALCLSRLGRLGEAVQTCDRLIRDFRHENAQRLKVQIRRDESALRCACGPSRYAQPGRPGAGPFCWAVALPPRSCSWAWVCCSEGADRPRRRRAHDAPLPLRPRHDGPALAQVSLLTSSGSNIVAGDSRNKAEFALVVVDWAWIAHRGTDPFRRITGASVLRTKGIARRHVPSRFLDPVLPTQTKTDGSTFSRVPD